MIPDKKWFLRLVEVLFFLSLATALLQKIVDPDIWFHLAIGRELVLSRALPVNEFLVYPNANLPGAYHEWGYALIYYLMHQLSGFWGMSILNAALCSLCFWFLFRAADPKAITKPIHIMVLLAAVWWMEFRLAYRVEIVLFVALACELWLLERFLSNRNWRWLVPIPLLGLVLAQLHPSVIFLLAILGFYSLEVVWECRNDRQELTRYLTWFTICGTATLLLSIVNPYGWEQLLLPFSFAGEQRVTNYVSEFKPSLATPMKWNFIFLLALSVGAVAVNRRRRLTDVLFVLVFGYLAYQYARNIALLALVMYMPISRGLSDLVQNFQTKLNSNSVFRFRPSSKWVIWALAMLFVAWSIQTRMTHPRWGAGPGEGLFPTRAAEIINEFQPPGRIFNFYDLGGYLAWALKGNYQVSIDGRHYKANRALALHNAVISGRPGWQTALESYGVNSIVVQGTRSYEAQMIPLVRILSDDPDWLLAGRGERAMLFFRAGAVPNFPDHGYLDKSQVWEQVRMEAETNISMRPNQAPAYRSWGEALIGLGQREQAIEAFRRYLEFEPDNEEIADLLLQLETVRTRDSYNQ